MSYAILFPGQGSQFVGMGADVFEARPDLLGPDADALLGWSLREACLDGTEEELTRTDRAQPALYAIGYALWSELERSLDTAPRAAAGHSLGEYTALAAARIMRFTDGLSLVGARATAMADAATAAASGMAAVIGDLESAEAICAARREMGGRLWVANLNAPGQVVVAGGVEDLEWAIANGRDLGARRVIPLKVAGAFHSPFMEPAAQRLAEAVADIEFADGAFPVWSNVTGQPHAAEEVARRLVDQLTAPVLFADSLLSMAAAGIDTFVHVGPGDVTAGLVKRTLPDATTIVVDTLDAVNAAAEQLASLQ